MNNDSKTLWLSLGAGLFAAFLLYSYSQEKKAEYDRAYGTMKAVVVAKKDIRELEDINESMIEVVQKPADFVQPGAISDPDQAIGQVAVATFKKGEQILETKLLQPGPETGIALQVSPGKRAVTLPVDEVRGVAKLIRPGDRIDIYTAVDTGKGVNQRREVSLMMQDVVVLATGVNVVNNIPRTVQLDNNTKNVIQTNLTANTTYTSLTIEASPKEAQDLIYIYTTSPANIFFTLRNPNDRAIPPRMPSSTSDSVLGRPSVSFEAPTAPMAPVAPAMMQTRPVVPSQVPARKSTTKGFRDL